MVPEGQKSSQWLCLMNLSREMCSQSIVSKALSWGTIRRLACILADITIRKSHPLELDDHSMIKFFVLDGLLR